MYIVYAKWLTFKPDPERHVAGVIGRFSKPMHMLGDVAAVIDVDPDEARDRLVGLVRARLVMFPDLMDGKAKTSDFRLSFVMGRIEEPDSKPRQEATTLPALRHQCSVSAIS